LKEVEMRTPDIEAHIALKIKIVASPTDLGPEYEVVETGDPALFLAFRPREREKVRVPETHLWLLGKDEEAPPRAHLLTAGDFRIAVLVGGDVNQGDEVVEDSPA
jgi:hypothetical protein